MAPDNAQTPSPIESGVTENNPLQSDNLEMQEVIQSLQKTLASQSETLQTKEKLLQTTQTDLQETRIFAENQRRERELIRAQLADLEQKNREAEEEKEAQKLLQTTQTDLQETRIFAENQRRESELIRAQLADLEQKNREAEEEKEAQKHLINSLQEALAQSKRKHANAQHIIKGRAEMDRSLLKNLDAIRFISAPQCRGSDEGKDNSTPKVFSPSGSQSQPTDYLTMVYGVQDSDVQDSDVQDSEARQEWEEDF